MQQHLKQALAQLTQSSLAVQQTALEAQLMAQQEQGRLPRQRIRAE